MIRIVIPASEPESPYTVPFAFYETTPHFAELFLLKKRFSLAESGHNAKMCY